MPVAVLMTVGVLAVSASAPLVAGMTVPALAVAFWRNAMAVVVVTPRAVVARRARARLTRRELTLSVVAGLALAVHFGTWIPSLRLTSVASSTALVSLQLAWVVLWEMLRGRRFGAPVVLGLGLALAGTVVVSGVDLTVSRRAVAGDLLALVGGIGTAAYMLLGARVRATVGTTTYTWVCYSTCAAVLGPLCLLSGQALGGYPARQWLLLVALTVTAQLLGHSVFNHLLATTSATRVGLALLLEVPGAALLAALFLGQRPPPTAVLGLVVILAGMALVVRYDRDRHRVEPPA